MAYDPCNPVPGNSIPSGLPPAHPHHAAYHVVGRIKHRIHHKYVHAGPPAAAPNPNGCEKHAVAGPGYGHGALPFDAVSRCSGIKAGSPRRRLCGIRWCRWPGGRVWRRRWNLHPRHHQNPPDPARRQSDHSGGDAAGCRWWWPPVVTPTPPTTVITTPAARQPAGDRAGTVQHRCVLHGGGDRSRPPVTSSHVDSRVARAV